MLSAALAEAGEAAWDAAAATTRAAERAPDAPLLAGARVPVDAGTAEHWVRRLLRLAGETGPAGVSLRAAAGAASLDALALLEAAITSDRERLAELAQSLMVDADALETAAALAAWPLLQALRRRFGSAVDPSWSAGYCPICGGWPLLAEERGLERTRRLRCGRCGGDWAQPGIRCPSCGGVGHAARAALVAEGEGGARQVEICGACRGYLKSVSTLRARDGAEVVLADLASIELDLAAVERGYARPAPRVMEPGVRVERG
jgi:FdhE protein